MSGAYLERLPEHLRQCINACWECRHLCQFTLFSHCLEMGGRHAAPVHVMVMMDCIEICQVTADFMTRQSPLHAETCRSCAEICDACAESCAQLACDEMAACAEACRKCAQACREMAGMGGIIGMGLPRDLIESDPAAVI